MKLDINKRFMMQKIIVILCCFLVSCSSEEKAPNLDNDIYLHIPDTRFESILIELGIDSDAKINQQILKTDAEDIRTLNLDFTNEGAINDLTGIEGFVNLRYLSAIQNELKEINLSSNTLLDTIYLQGNYLTDIDISKNPNLVMIDLASNLLTSITGVSEAIHLKNLKLSFNYFEEFSVHNESIENLMMSHNLLKSLNTYGSKNLKHILLRTNEISSLDLSSNTLLETLVLSDNKIEHINLEQNSELTHLYISSNSLTNLDVSKLQELIDLKIDRNPDLMCIKIQSNQNIPSLSKSDYQELSNTCN